MTTFAVVATILATLTATAFGQNACQSPVTVSGDSTFGSANPYSNYQKCRWIVNAAPGKDIELTFINQFDIEYSSSCSYDRVVVYDADSVDAVLGSSVCASQSLSLPGKFGPYCGQSAPSEPIRSSGNRVVVEFCTDSSSTGRGFQLQAREVAGNPAPQSGDDCNVEREVDGKTTVTYYNNAGYPSFTKCHYKFTSKNGRPLKITALRFNLEGFLGCRYDSLKVSEDGNVIGTFCGSNGPREFRSSGPVVELDFVSDQYTNGKGFSLEISESCTGDHLCRKQDETEDDVCYNEVQTCNGSPQCPSGSDESACDDCGSSSWDTSSSFPGAAAITHIDGLIHCGGALINKDHVLTAAHCFHRLDDKPERFVVKLGAARLSNAELVQIEKVTIHPRFNPRNLQNNLAIVKLAKPAPLHSTLSPFCIPNTEAQGIPAAGTRCYTLGWGRTVAQDINSYASIVKHLTATIETNSRCRWSSSPVVVDDTNICASTSNKLCYGDNGAPLVCQAANNRWQVVGINSVAFGCTSTSNIPASFTKVISYKDWILENAF